MKLYLIRAGTIEPTAVVSYRSTDNRTKALLQAAKELGLDRRYYTSVALCKRVAGITFHVQFGHQIKSNGGDTAVMLSDLFIANISEDQEN